ncbi:MAG: Trans-aconitate 2-methyltransferase [Alphaproteobacteria bacterium]|nr:Trans-aconitate 2-methyltransferase [Alphaproteobacteria bacterium]
MVKPGENNAGENGIAAGPVPESASSAPQPEQGQRQALRREGKDLLRARWLVKREPVTALQLLDPSLTVNPVLLSPGQNVAVLTDKFGQAASAYAAARPHWQVTGWVNDTKTFLALQKMTAPENLSFDKRPQNALRPSQRPKAILAVAWAHRFLSENNHHAGALIKEVRHLLDLLPDHGQLLIQDFALPDDHESFVILELENDEAIKALLEFSYTARPHVPKALRGFFIESLGSYRPGIERFRLPKKWAVEFYHRWRHGIMMDVPFELTTLSIAQWVNLFEQCGARATYRAPKFIDREEAGDIEQALRFYNENDEKMPLPPATFTLLVEKIPAESSLLFYERRNTGEKAKNILISGLKSKNSDEKIDIAEIRHHEDDILPWYRDGEGRLHILVQTNVARPIINSVPRGTPNLDGRSWAGYLIEPIAIPHVADDISVDFIFQEMTNKLPDFPGTCGTPEACVEYYPAPDYLVQRVRGILFPLLPEDTNAVLPDIEIESGRIIDVLADDVLYAISAGLIPDGKLEILISKLFIELAIQPLDTGVIPDRKRLERAVLYVKDRREARLPRSVKFAGDLEEYVADNPTENLRAVRSIFAEDQASEYGRNVGNYTEQDFIVSNALTANTAICIPLLRDPMGRLLMSGEPRRLPVPVRLGTENPLMHMPSFSLPASVRTVEEARLFLAKQLECDEDDIHVLGPSFFVQPQVSAERVYPFLLAAPPKLATWMRWYRPRSRLQRMITPHVEKSTAYMEFYAMRLMGEWYSGFGPDMVPDMGKDMTRKNPGRDFVNDFPFLVEEEPPAPLVAVTPKAT